MSPYATQKHPNTILWISILVTLFALLFFPQDARLEGDPALQLYKLVNDTRLVNGLPPLGWSKLLSQAAQRHAEDMATQGNATSQGSDGSDHRQRIREAGYRAWYDGLLVEEAVWMGLGTAEDALTWFRNNPEQWRKFLDPKYREVGIGYAEDEQGIHYFAIDFGSRPGVLPVFINDGTEATDSPQVAVRLTNEEAEPLGEGTWIGKAIEVRLNSQPDFSDVPWQPWEPLLPWLLDGTEPGEYAVYVEYRDGAGRTAVAEDTIRLVSPGEVLPEPTPHREGPVPTLAATEELPLPTPTRQPSPETTEPQPTLTLAETIATTEPLDMTPQPTWTPLPTPEEALETKPIDWPLVLSFTLQAVALVLGIVAFLHRR